MQASNAAEIRQTKMIYRDVNYFFFTGRGRKKERNKNEKKWIDYEML